MSAEDWKPCPRCAKRAEEAFEEAKARDEFNYEELKILEALKEAYEKGYPRHKDDLDVEVRLVEVEKIEDKLGHPLDNIYPTEGKFRPVRVDREAHLKHDKISLRYTARCRNCNYKWSVNEDFEGER